MSTEALPSPPRQRLPVTLIWMAHWALRVWLAGMLLIYGWSKVFLMQMGRAGYGDALISFGEMSPMGLLWRFMAFSPVVQMLAGAAEVLAATLLLFRRTAWIGGLLAAADMAVVLLLNMTFDVPVKQLALALGVSGVIVAMPFLPRLLRFVAGREPGPPRLPTPLPWRRPSRVAKVASPIFAALILIGSAVGFQQAAAPPSGATPVAGVYRVIEDSAKPADQLIKDTRWQQISFDQYPYGDRSRFALRQANGELLFGTYQVNGDEIDISMATLHSETPFQEAKDTLQLTWERQADDRISLTGKGVDLLIAPDPEFRFLFDRDFSWAPRPPLNR